jgi:hypothetical protein
MIPSRMIALWIAGIASLVVIRLGAVNSVNAFVTAPAAASTFVASPSRDESSFRPRSMTTANPAASRTEFPSRLHGLFGSGSGTGTGIGTGSSANKNAADGTTSVIVNLKANEVKVGALRFLLQIYLVGEQNNPVPKSWLIKGGNDSGELLVYYGDGTGMVKIQLHESGIQFQRVGEKPSLQYVLQESVLLHGILDELENVAFGVEDIDESKRLLRLADSGAIAAERTRLPARKLGS